MLEVIAQFKTSLASGISDSALLMTLVSNGSADGDGETIPNASYGFVIDEENSAREYVIGTVDGTEVTITKRGVSFVDGVTEKDSNKFSHRKGASIKITDHPVVASMVEAFNGREPVGGVLLLPEDRVISEDRHIVDKEYVDVREGYWEGAVENYASLPVGSNDGEARVTLDDSKLYIWDEGTTTWILASSGGGSGTVYRENFLGSEAVGGDNKTFTLSSGSFPDEKYLQVYLNGALMEYGASNDYLTSGGNTAIFNTAVLDTDTITMLVVSVDLYNPDWNDVNSDLIPDITSLYDIGTDALRFKDVYLSGSIDAAGDVSIGGDISVEGDALGFHLYAFGVGSDGDVTIASGTTTLTSDMHAENLTIEDGAVLKPNGFRIFVRKTLTFEGTGIVDASGGRGGDAAYGPSGDGDTMAGGPAGALANTAGTLPASEAGGKGATGDTNAGLEIPAGDGVSTVKGLNESDAGDSGDGGGASPLPAGVSGLNTGTISNPFITFTDIMYLRDYLSDNARFEISPSPGGAGGGIRADSSPYVTGGGGGGAGAPGGIVWIEARRIVTVDTENYVTVAAGDGGAGGYVTSVATSGTGAGGGGGGAGGNGGVAIVIYETLTGSGTIDVSAGTGGALGAGQSNSGGTDGPDGIAGENGVDGTRKIFELK